MSENISELLIVSLNYGKNFKNILYFLLIVVYDCFGLVLNCFID